MFIIKTGLRIAGAWALGIATGAALCGIYSDQMFAAKYDGENAYEQAYLRRELFKSGLWLGALTALPGGILGMMACAKGRPLWRGALYGGLSLVPIAGMFILNPFTTEIALAFTPVCLVIASLSGLIAGLGVKGKPLTCHPPRI